ncbi:glycosyltransferase [Halomarina halobia]|uniref:Glycosyltransferase n=1 Tax=Halomarina halobia TaxID=3033386 RepID=A0ABD6A7J4_9EURY|nr:glycosyltransferase [Halomarina sp. PSR21]
MQYRVLHLITRFLDGGAERTTEIELDALSSSAEKYDLRLGVGAKHDQKRIKSVKSLGVTSVVFSLMRHYNPLTSCFAVVSVWYYLSRENIDVLHTHSTEAGIIGRFAAALARTDIVIHEIHGDPITEDRNRILNACILILERAAAPLADKLVVKSERIRDTYLERNIGKLEQYELIQHGVEVEQFQTASPASDVMSTSITLLYAGRLEEGKGLFDLVEAVERLQMHHDIKLLIVGKGSLNSRLVETIENRGLDNVVKLLGYREDIPQIMQAADIFVLPSYREGTPRVITEALAAQLPVVSTEIAGIPDQVDNGNTGYLVKPGDIDGLVHAIEQILTCPNCLEMTTDIEEYSLIHSQCKFRHLYDSLLD